MKNIAFALILTLCAYTAETPSWPAFHGVNHDSICPEKGFLKSWPENGPKLLWKFEALGKGYAAVSIADGMIFTAGDIGKENVIFALDMNGKQIWKQATGKAWKNDYPGSRGTPTYSDGMVFHLSGSGMLAALNAKTGKIIWSVDIAEKYKARIGAWGLSESILVDGDNIVCMPGSSEALMISLNKKTGKQIWSTASSAEIEDDASYCSPVIVEIAGTRQILAMSAKHLLGINAKTGKLIWRFFYETGCNVHATTPVYSNGHIFITSGYGKDSKLLKLSKDGTSVKEVWSSHDMENHHGGVVLVDGYIYGSGDNVWSCIKFDTGKTAWKEKEGKGSILYADKMLYLVNEGGKVALIEASPKAYKEAGSFEIPNASKDSLWAHPVICDGKLYIRHANTLYVYKIK